MHKCNRRTEYYAVTIAFEAENENVEFPATLLSYLLPIGPFYATAFHLHLIHSQTYQPWALLA